MTREYFIVSKPKKSAELNYSDLLDNSESSWHLKAKSLRMRRWRMLKQANKDLRQKNSW